MSYEKEARITLVGAELRAVEATGVSLQDYVHSLVREAVDRLMAPAPEPVRRKSR